MLTSGEVKSLREIAAREKAVDLARTNEDDHPIGMQIYGSDPALLAEAARKAVIMCEAVPAPDGEMTVVLGAGGGGYMLLLARDAGAARRIEETLTAEPPNDRARFVALSLSQTGLQVTRS